MEKLRRPWDWVLKEMLLPLTLPVMGTDPRSPSSVPVSLEPSCWSWRVACLAPSRPCQDICHLPAILVGWLSLWAESCANRQEVRTQARIKSKDRCFRTTFLLRGGEFLMFYLNTEGRGWR